MTKTKTAKNKLMSLQKTLRDNLATEAMWVVSTRTDCDSLNELLQEKCITLEQIPVELPVLDNIGDGITINFLTTLLQKEIEPNNTPKMLLILAQSLAADGAFEEEIDYIATVSYFRSIAEYSTIIKDKDCARAASAFANLLA